MILHIIGLGLIGGSAALDLKKAGWASTILGTDLNPEHARQALDLGLVDEVVDLEIGFNKADVVLLAIPVDAGRKLLPSLLDKIRPHQVILDMGSTKAGISGAVKAHPNRSRYVACHPIAGTEFSGPAAAHSGLFDHKVNIICNPELSAPDALEKVQSLFAELGMTTITMDAQEHDRHIAYVSHLSHVTSFSLGLTVLDIEKDEKNIFNMAGSGFASTARLAKSSPDMWAPIFEQNADYLVEALDEYIKILSAFREAISNRDRPAVYRLIQQGNDIRRILDGIELKQGKK
jgi:prephenate dehydrogenase